MKRDIVHKIKIAQIGIGIWIIPMQQGNSGLSVEYGAIICKLHWHEATHDAYSTSANADKCQNKTDSTDPDLPGGGYFSRSTLIFRGDADRGLRTADPLWRIGLAPIRPCPDGFCLGWAKGHPKCQKATANECNQDKVARWIEECNSACVLTFDSLDRNAQGLITKL